MAKAASEFRRVVLEPSLPKLLRRVSGITFARLPLNLVNALSTLIAGCYQSRERDLISQQPPRSREARFVEQMVRTHRNSFISPKLLAFVGMGLWCRLEKLGLATISAFVDRVLFLSQ